MNTKQKTESVNRRRIPGSLRKPLFSPHAENNASLVTPVFPPTPPHHPSHNHSSPYIILQPLDQCFGQVKLMYYEEMTWARARDFNNISIASWIETFERALSQTLGHPTDGPKMIKHSYNGKTGMYPCDPRVCIDRIKERVSLRQTKEGLHAERIPQIESSKDEAVIAKLKNTHGSGCEPSLSCGLVSRRVKRGTRRRRSQRRSEDKSKSLAPLEMATPTTANVR